MDRNRIDLLMKRELERLMLENQELHIKLRRFDVIWFLVRRLGSVARSDVGGWLRGPVKRRPQPKSDPNFASSFRPYEVRPKHPPLPHRPRVLHAIANLYTGGSTRLVVDLVEHLGDRFEQLAVIRDNPLRPHYLGLEAEVAEEISDPGKALALLERVRPDLVHVHFLGHHRNQYSQDDWQWYDGLFQATSEYGCPVIENVNIPVAPYFSEAVRRYVFVSDYVRERFGRDEDPTLTIYPGSNFELFSRSQEAGPPDGCVGMVYRLEKDKLDETAIDVFTEVLRRRRGTRALIVGGGRFLERYRTAVEDAGLSGEVTFTTYVAYEDLPRLYEQMSIFVAPPHSESFGHVVPLAMNMGIPVAAYEVGALPEILGNRDVLVPPGDVAALATKIVELLDDRERRLRIGAENRERAQRLFSVEKMIECYESLYDELLAAT